MLNFINNRNPNNLYPKIVPFFLTIGVTMLADQLEKADNIEIAYDNFIDVIKNTKINL